MSAHDLSLLGMGVGIGVYAAFVALVLAAVLDDFRILRRDRVAAPAKD